MFLRPEIQFFNLQEAVPGTPCICPQVYRSSALSDYKIYYSIQALIQALSKKILIQPLQSNNLPVPHTLYSQLYTIFLYFPISADFLLMTDAHLSGCFVRIILPLIYLSIRIQKLSSAIRPSVFSIIIIGS